MSGIIIAVALFVAMFVLLVSTILVAKVSFDCNLSLGSVDATECRYLSLGAVNQLLSDLDTGAADVDTYTKQSPRQVHDNGCVIKSWVEPLYKGGQPIQDGQPVLVVAQTTRPGLSRPAVVKRLATFQNYPMTRVYTNAPDNNPNTPDPIYYNNGPGANSWDRLPSIPRMWYSSSGVLQTAPGQTANSIPYIAGSPTGSMYAVYSPELDGINDTGVSPTFLGFTIPFLKIQEGALARRTIALGAQEGMTVGELVPAVQVLVSNFTNITISKGAVLMEYSHDAGQWSALPPLKINGSYHIDGVNGLLSSYDGGLMTPIYMKGQDVIAQYSDKAKNWNVITPPGKDVLFLTTDRTGTAYVQTGNLLPVGLPYLLNILLGNLTHIYANTRTSALHEYKDGKWTSIPNPPAQFYNTAGQLVDNPYPPGRGATLNSMVGGNSGTLYVVSKPSMPGLVDTVYKYSDGKWTAVPSPPKEHYDSAGQEIKQPGLPSTLIAGRGANGELILREPTSVGNDAIFLQTKKGYQILPPVGPNGGPYQRYVSQMSGGQRRNDDNRGSFVVKATYF